MMTLFNSLNRTDDRSTEVEGFEDLLNRPLFVTMCGQRNKFGMIGIVRRGEPLCGSYTKDPRNDRTELVITSRGETYTGNCPFCNDTRGRLWVSHIFGTVDAELSYRHSETWKCYNNECQGSVEHRQKLEDMILFPTRVAPSVRSPIVKSGPKGLEPCVFPGDTVPVAFLEPDHPAAAYLDGRNFDRDELSRIWGVMLASRVPTGIRGSAAQGRIIIPVRVCGRMVGWQARYAGDADWKKMGIVKYLTYFPKSLAVYGIDEVDADGRYPYIAAMEGATDVWRHGPGAVCPFGKTFSPTQIKIVAERLDGRPLVLVPDQDDRESSPNFVKTAKAVNASQKVNGWPLSPIGLVDLPEGKDPGSIDRNLLRELCAHAATHPAWYPGC